MDPLARLAQVPRRPPRSDLALAVLLAVWAVAEVLPPGPDPLWAGIAFALVTTVPLAVRRHVPLLVLAVIVAALLLRAATADGPPATVAPFPAMLVAAFSAALHTRSLPVALGAWCGAVGGMAGAIVLQFYDTRPDAGSAVVMV
ncbi:hypothetical protein AB0G11_48900, partial [Nonomuraea sp. NPDC023979]